MVSVLSAVILARNEQHNIEPCIHSVRPHVSNVVLIDMESDDATVKLAAPLVDKVLHHPLVRNFDSARNMAIAEVQTPWIWFVDADERISMQTGKLVNELIQDHGDEFEAINIPFKTYFCGKWIEHSGWWPGYTMPRVLKKGHFRFSQRLHGGVELDGREIRFPPDPSLGIDHFSYLTLEHYIEKFNRYTSTEAAQLYQAGQSIDWRNAIAHMMCDLWMYYEGNGGVLDGRHGWLLAWLSGQYRWLSHAKLLDCDAHKEEPGAELYPNNLDSVLAVMRQELERLRHTRPVLPLGVVWKSPIWDPSGYADEGRCIAKALSQTDRHVSLEEIPWSHARCEIGPEDTALFGAMLRAARARSNISITNCIPTLARPDPAAAINVIRTTFETDRIPGEWNQHLERYDEIWVISQHNRTAFIRSGLSPERIRRVPSFLDTELYRPDGPKLELPAELRNRFVYLSVFDWQYRKGWDLLIKAYCQCFGPDSGVGLLLKISRAHGHNLESVRRQVREIVESTGPSKLDRTDIVIMDDQLSAREMASLYRAVDAFVLPSRGEGWGRPYMEAMACGLPTIGTGASGNVDFMNSENSVLVPAELVDVPALAAQEINVYAGHRWYEPDFEKLCEALVTVHQDPELRKRIGKAARKAICANHDITAGRRNLDHAIGDLDSRFVRPVLAEPDENKVRVIWEGEFFAGHSFANINESLAKMFFDHENIEFAIKRQVYNPTFDREHPDRMRFQAYCERSFKHGAHVVVRHAFPPDWTTPESGRWIHIQPWEFGHLPQTWIEPLRDRVDEIWVPSNYVRRVFENSGIPGGKIHVMPWGIDPQVFSPDAPSRILPTDKSFRFLFVGGTIPRKGYDRVLQAYLEEFTRDDDVCLVVKDLGVNSFYRFGNLRDETIRARDDHSNPEILYFESEWTPGQLASLYTACNCLVMPYRGEGFGLPILEAMACGVAPIVPRGGASDDFVTEETGLFLEAKEVETHHELQLVGPALELGVDIGELRKLMRSAYIDAAKTTEIGGRAAKHVRENFTWRQSFERMAQRIEHNAKIEQPDLVSVGTRQDSLLSGRRVTVCIKTFNNEKTLADCLSCIMSNVDEMIVVDLGSSDRTVAIAREYGARTISAPQAAFRDEQILSFVHTAWYFWLEPDAILSDEIAEQIGPLVKAQPKVSTEVSMQVETTRHDQPETAKPKMLKFMRVLGMSMPQPL